MIASASFSETDYQAMYIQAYVHKDRLVHNISSFYGSEELCFRPRPVKKQEKSKHER